MIRAATRDASFYRRPDVRSPKVYHVIATPGFSACGRMLYDQPESWDALTDSVPAAEVAHGMRCQRPGCKTRWPEYEPARTYATALPAPGVPAAHDQTKR